VHVVSDTIKHRHAELIKAWADGAKIESRTLHTHAKNTNVWQETTEPAWSNTNLEFRIKIEPKPDRITFLTDYRDGWSEAPVSCYVRGSKRALKLTHDGETGELKSAEVL
jgi:hypothetical protein